MRFINLAIIPPFVPWYHPQQFELPFDISSRFNLISLKGDSRSGAFEGSAYEDIIFYTTGYSLDTDYIPPDDIKDIHGNLAYHLSEMSELTEDFAKIMNLESFFRVCVENNLGLIKFEE